MPKYFLLNKLLSKGLQKLSNLLLFLSKYCFYKSLKIFPWKSLNKLDYKVSKILPEILNKETFYLEVGANDGIKQSNTYFLESLYGARGLLIEASPSNFEKCVINRSSKNLFQHCALVSSSYKSSYLEMIYSDLMTVSTSATGLKPKNHARKGLKFFNGVNYNFFAPAKTLSSILNSFEIRKIDFMSMDIEGGEFEALNGINFDEVYIKNILIETREFENINKYLMKYGYYLLEKLSQNDYLFTKNLS